MKKIVALVLCLALALSLCTVAFAATTSVVTTGGDATSSDYESDAGYVLKRVDTNAKASEKFTMKVTTWTNKVVTKNGETTTTYYAPKYELGSDVYYAVADDAAEFKLLDKNGNVVTGLMKSTQGKAVATTKVVTLIPKDADKNCGSYVNGNDAVKVYKDADGEDYLTVTNDTGDYGYLNGKLVPLGATSATKVPHTFTSKKFTYKSTSDTTIVGVKCTECDQTFEVVKDLPFGFSGSYDYINHTTGVIVDTKDTYIVLYPSAGTTAGNNSSNTVESAKTFDAGIALYAGMALASVAGSAVVIGKKKEF